MRPILNKLNPLQLNALFIQPTRWCGLNCKGCYVKEHQGGEESYHTPMEQQARLLEYFLSPRMHHGLQPWANQITISMDDLHSDLYKRIHMVNLFSNVLTLRRNARIQSPDWNPELHMTFHTMGTVQQYLKASISSWEDLKLLDMISISEINPWAKDWREGLDLLAHQTMVNYNHLVPAGVTSLNIDRHVRKLTEIGKIVHHIYLVIFKNPIGRDRPELMKIGETSRMASDIMYINTMMERLPEDVRNKISVDGCLQDTIKYTRTGFGCSSNVSRVQVWPDGSVTGCPYAFSGAGAIGRTAEDILENITRARKQYDFKELCHLPEVYNSVGQRPKNSGLEVQARR